MVRYQYRLDIFKEHAMVWLLTLSLHWTNTCTRGMMLVMSIKIIIRHDPVWERKPTRLQPNHPFNHFLLVDELKSRSLGAFATYPVLITIIRKANLVIRIVLRTQIKLNRSTFKDSLLFARGLIDQSGYTAVGWSNSQSIQYNSIRKGNLETRTYDWSSGTNLLSAYSSRYRCYEHCI